jgi:hypothetical protein
VRMPSQCWVRHLRMLAAIAVFFGDKCGASAVTVLESR